jgi:hypothetical protein
MRKAYGNALTALSIMLLTALSAQAAGTAAPSIGLSVDGALQAISQPQRLSSVFEAVAVLTAISLVPSVPDHDHLFSPVRDRVGSIATGVGASTDPP